MKKKLLIVGGSIVALLLILLVILLFVGGNDEKLENPDLDSRYPYQLIRTKEGLRVVIEGGEKGCSWYEGTSDAFVIYPISEKKNAKRETFLLRSMTPGTATVTFTLTNDENTYDVVYQIFVEANVSESGVTLVSCSHSEIGGMVLSEDGRYLIAQQTSNEFLVSIRSDDNTEWMASTTTGAANIQPCVTGKQLLPDAAGTAESTSEDTAEAAIKIVAENAFRITISDVSVPSSAEIIDRSSWETLRLEFAPGDQGITLASHGFYYSDESSPLDTWQLPEAAELIMTQNANYMSQVSGDISETELAFFQLGSETMVLYRSKQLKREDFCKTAYDESVAAGDPGAGERDGVLYCLYEGTAVAAWDAGGMGYFLVGIDSMDIASLEETVTALREANK